MTRTLLLLRTRTLGVQLGDPARGAATIERYAAVERSRDKARARQAFAAAGLPTPGFATHPRR